jgi:hypothetical protein
MLRRSFRIALMPNVLRISVGRRADETSEEEEAATQFCVGLSRVRGYLEFEE